MNGSRRDTLLAAGTGGLMAGASLLAARLTPQRLLADAPGRQPLSALVPAAFGAWQQARGLRLVPPTPDVAEALARTYDDTLALAYADAGRRQLVMLSLCWGRSQRGDGILHRPEVCYAGQGFTVRRHGGDADADGNGGAGSGDTLRVGSRTLPVTRLETRGPRAEPVTYWLVVGGEVVRFGLGWRLATLAHALRGDIADGLLVRLSSIDTDAARGFALHAGFVRDLAAALSADAASRLLGRLP